MRLPHKAGTKGHAHACAVMRLCQWTGPLPAMSAAALCAFAALRWHVPAAQVRRGAPKRRAGRGPPHAVLASPHRPCRVSGFLF